jgi:hypothetical protein
MENEPKEYAARSQTIFRKLKNKENPFVMIDRRILENPALSYKAKGILAYLLSRPDDWEINYVDLVNRSVDGKSSVRSGLIELIRAGHISRKAERSEAGRFARWVLEVYENPVQPDPEDALDNVDPLSDFEKVEPQPLSDYPQMENPQMENQPQLILNLKETELNENKEMGASAPAPQGIIKNQAAYDALVKFERDHPKGGLDLSSFPEEIRPVLAKLCDLWKIKPPSPKGKKSGEFALWITEGRSLLDACGEFGPEILDAVYRDWRANFKNGVPFFTVGRPGTLVRTTRGKAGALRSGIGLLPGMGQPDEEEDCSAIREEMRLGREQRKLEIA